MPTAKVEYNSDLKRKAWVREGLVQSADISFWSPLTGTTENSVVFLAKNENASTGHTVVFDFDGNLAGKAVLGRERAFGKGEQKKKFSSKITVARYRLVVDNGDVFDAVDIGDLSISQHSDSRKKLSDLFQRFKDQTLFDSAQGLTSQSPTHVIEFLTTFGYNELLDLEKILKTSEGFSTGSSRRPLKPYMLKDGQPCWMLVVDPAVSSKLKKDNNYQSLVYNADVRGNSNRAIKGVFGKIGNLIIMEASQFFGENEKSGSVEFYDTSVEIPGLRQKDSANVWTGQPGFSVSGAKTSRCLILGAGALQMAFGKQPDYKHQLSEDFGITSESALEFWMDVQKTKLKAEQSDYKKAKVADVDFGVVAVDIKV